MDLSIWSVTHRQSGATEVAEVRWDKASIFIISSKHIEADAELKVPFLKHSNLILTP